MPEPTEAEQVTFLTAAIASTEATIRAYDTKAQVGAATFVLSITALVSLMGRAVSAPSNSNIASALLCIMAVATLIAFFSVLIPFTSPRLQHRSSLGQVRKLFYVNQQEYPDIETYLSSIAHLNRLHEMSYELLKLSRIRDRKDVRFRIAVGFSLVFYLIFMYQFLQTIP